jgi:4-diphosphocytidyl-2-C-methyl-D-erythritol kinase
MWHHVSPTVLRGQAPAKVNLYLRVLAKRPDSFHELETVMVKLRSLTDTLTFELRPEPICELEITLAYPRGLEAITVPVTDDNLVLKAARLLQTETGSKHGVRIQLVKRIPPAAGLGGGSSDAATTLSALNQLWRLGMDQPRLIELASRLGSDVPFFLADSAAVLCTGRGEVLTPLRLRGTLPLVIARPDSGLSTPAVYRACHPEPEGPSAREFLDLCDRQGISGAAHRLHNSLQAPAESLNADVSRLRRWFSGQGVVAHQMTGSGSAYFAVCATARQARLLSRRLRTAGIPWVCETATAG